MGSVATTVGTRPAILISHGTQQTFTYPDSIATAALGINNRGQVVGYYYDAGGEHGFVGTPGSLRPVDVPGAAQTVAYAINDWGQIAGSYNDAGGQQHGFLDTRGHYASIDVPGAQTTSVTGINDWGQLVGSYVDSTNHSHGFVLSGGGFQTLDVPGASRTVATGINNLGQIVGYSEALAPVGTQPQPSPPQAQLWVAKPSFIHGTFSAGMETPVAAGSGMALPQVADVAALVRAVAEREPGRSDPASWWTDQTSGNLSAAIATLEAASAAIAGHHDWPGLTGTQSLPWETQNSGSG